MAGYTPVFGDIFTGSLYGRWPAAAVWASLLPLMDKNGHLDMSLQAISGMTGWPMNLLEQGIQQLMEPDPYSRTPGHDGRRLIPIDPERPWGWIAVNHGKYREKARKQMHQAEATASGKDAERKQAARESRRVQTRPGAPGSHTQTQTHISPPTPPAKPRAVRLPQGFALSPDLSVYASEKLPDCDPVQLFAKFCEQAQAKGWEYVDWRAAFQTYCRNARADSGHFSAGQYPRKGSNDSLAGVRFS